MGPPKKEASKSKVPSSYVNVEVITLKAWLSSPLLYWGKADDRNCNYGHPKKADVESGKNLFVD